MGPEEFVTYVNATVQRLRGLRETMRAALRLYDTSLVLDPCDRADFQKVNSVVLEVTTGLSRELDDTIASYPEWYETFFPGGVYYVEGTQVGR